MEQMNVTVRQVLEKQNKDCFYQQSSSEGVSVYEFHLEGKQFSVNKCLLNKKTN